MFSHKVDPRTFSRKIDLTIIAALYDRGVINQEEKKSYIPEDLKNFKKLTENHIVVAGRKTHESIIKKLGKPLPDRKTIILTNNKSYHFTHKDCQVIAENGLNKVLEIAKHKKVFVIGGGEIFKLFMPFATKMVLSYVDLKVEGEDTFPNVPDDDWEIISSEKKHCIRSQTDFQIVTYIKKSRT